MHGCLENFGGKKLFFDCQCVGTRFYDGIVVMILWDVGGNLKHGIIDLMGVECGQVEKVKDAMLSMVSLLNSIGSFHKLFIAISFKRIHQAGIAVL